MRVIISGAGVAGPTAAFWLSKAGHSVTIVERASSLEPIGQNIDVDGGALRVVQKMGLHQGLRELNTTEVGTRFIRSDGMGAYASFPLIKGRMGSPTSENEILRGDLAMLLCSATRDDPNVRYLLGTTIEKVGEDQGGGGDGAQSPPLRVQLSNGDSEIYDACIVADGQWSRIRKEHFPAPTVVDKNAYIAYFTVPRTSVDQGWWELYHSLNSRVVSTRPDPQGTTRGSFMKMPLNKDEKAVWEKASRSGSREVQNSLLTETFKDAGWESKRLIEGMVDAKDFYFQALKQIRMPVWSDETTGRIACVGDAAYAPTPISGSGAVLAILGGYIIAGELSQLQPGQHPREAFKAYERTLRPYVEEVQNLPSFVPGVMMPETWWHRSLLQNGLWLAAKLISIPWLRPKETRHDESSFKLPIYPAFEKGSDEVTLESKE